MLIGVGVFVLIVVAVKLGIDWAFYMPPYDPATMATTDTTSTTMSGVDINSDSTSIPSVTQAPTTGVNNTANNDPYDIYFYPTPCSTSVPDGHGLLKTWKSIPNTISNELKHRASELAGNDYYQQSKLYEDAIQQYEAQQSIDALSQSSDKVKEMLSVYKMSQDTLQKIVAESEQKCPDNFVAQQDEIVIQMNSYAGL